MDSSRSSSRTQTRLPVFINGKFLGQRVTGVQRAAHEFLTALDGLLDANRAFAGRRVVLVIPANASAPRLNSIRVKRTRISGGHFWEQIVLPWTSRQGLLLNLAGTSPAAKRRQFCFLYDAAIYDAPEAYTLPFRTWYRFLFWWLSISALKVFTSSRFSQNRLLQFLPKLASKIEVVPCGGDHFDRVSIDPAIGRRLKLEKTPYLLAVGSANPTKNFARLIEAMCLVDDLPDLRLIVAGGMNSSVFAAGNIDAGDPKVTFAGAVTDGELKALYSNALAFVFPSTYEGFGLPPLEAMSCRCPVAAARAASIPETCGSAALYFDPLSSVDMAAKLRRIVIEPALRADLVNAGLKRISETSWSMAAARLLKSCEDHLRSIGA